HFGIGRAGADRWPRHRRSETTRRLGARHMHAACGTTGSAWPPFRGFPDEWQAMHRRAAHPARQHGPGTAPPTLILHVLEVPLPKKAGNAGLFREHDAAPYFFGVSFKPRSSSIGSMLGSWPRQSL